MDNPAVPDIVVEFEETEDILVNKGMVSWVVLREQ
jgi:hypothetical protein